MAEVITLYGCLKPRSRATACVRRARLADRRGMNIQIFGTKKCAETRKAERWFKERGIKFQRVDLAEKAMSLGELRSVAQRVGGIEQLIDRAGKRYENKGLKFSAPTGPRIETALFEDPLLLRTPIVRNGAQAAVGYHPEIWETWS
jgi:arsenate reductase-like glutaredoxin family protein